MIQNEGATAIAQRQYGQAFYWTIALMMLSLLSMPAIARSASSGWGVADLASEVSHTVVNIYTTQTVKTRPMPDMGGRNNPFGEFFEDFFGGQMPRERKTSALGSGFIIPGDGLILTNNHVVGQADEINVRLANDKTYAAEIVGTDPKTDLALIQVDTDEAFPQPAQLGDSDAILVGDAVMAVGNPFGLGHTVTTGILSAKGRIIGAGPYDDFLQTDAAINPGNSGGPLFNLEGEVIGINTAIVARGQGIGFAIPINLAVSLLPQLKKGEVVRGWLGVMIQEMTEPLTRSFNLDRVQGVLVASVVADGPADKAGLKNGDIILAMEGENVESTQDLSRRVAATQPDTKVKLSMLRNGKRRSVTVTLGTLPKGPKESAESATQSPDTQWGMQVEAISPQVARQLGVPADEAGVLIAGIQPGSPGDDAGLRQGDIIKEVDHQPVGNLSDFSNIVEDSDGDQLLLLIKRRQGTLYVVLEK